MRLLPDGVNRRNLLLLMTLSFLVNTGFSSVGLLIPYYILALKGVLREIPEVTPRVEASEAVIELGVMMSAFMIVRTPSATVFGWLSDRVGRRTIITVGTVLYTVTGILYMMARSWMDLVYVRAFQGVASAMVWPVAEALLADSVPPTFRGRALSLYVSSMNLGFMAGPTIGALTYKLVVYGFNVKDVILAFKLPFALIALFNAAAVVVALLTVEPEGYRSGLRREEVASIRGLPRWSRRSLYVLFFNGLANGFAVGILSSVMYVYVIEYVAKDPLVLGVINTTSGLLGLIASYPVAWLSDRIGRKGLIIAGYVISRAAVFTLPFIRSVEALLLTMSILNIAFNVSMPLMRALQADIVPSSVRGRVFGIQQSFFNGGMAAGPIAGSNIYSLFEDRTIAWGLPGLILPFWIAGSIGFLTLTLFITLVTERRYEAEPIVSEG